MIAFPDQPDLQLSVLPSWMMSTVWYVIRCKLLKEKIIIKRRKSRNERVRKEL